MKNQNVIIHIIQILIIILFMVSLVPKQFQNDTFFVIALGEKYLNEGINTEEKLVWHEGLEYQNSRWLFDIIVAKIYNMYNFIGVYIFVIIVSILQAVCYYIIINKITKKKFLALIYTLLIFGILNIEFTARAQIISFLLFLLEFYSIERLMETNKKRYFIILMIIPILLINFHAPVFAIYYIFYLPYIGEFILSKLNLKAGDKLIIENRNITRLIILILLSFLLAFINPSGFKPYSYIFVVINNIDTSFIMEMKKLTIDTGLYFVFLLGIVFAIMCFTKVKVKITDAFFILGFGIMSLFAYRSIMFFYLISSICIFRIINDFLEEYNFNFDFVNKKYKIIIYFIFIIWIVLVSINKLFNNLKDDYVDTENYPVSATNYILNNIDISNMRIYNHFNFGSYLELNKIKVFIDSRAELYTVQFNKDITILNDWQNIINGEVDYKEIFEKYNITHALLYNTELINFYIDDDPNWKIIYQDDCFSLYEKVQ